MNIGTMIISTAAGTDAHEYDTEEVADDRERERLERGRRERHGDRPRHVWCASERVQPGQG